MLLEGLVADGGEDGCYARVDLAAQLIDEGEPDEALAQLAELARDPAVHDGHCQWAAELLAEHGQQVEALRWYDRLVARMAPERLDAVCEADGWLAMESIALRGRREVRRELGLPPDATDEIVPDPPEGGLDALLERLAGLERRTPHGCRASVDLPACRARRSARRWPDDYDDDPGHYAEVERRRRARAEAGGRTVIVPGTVAELIAFAEAHGGSPLDEEVRKRYCASIADARTLTWPPARNAPCWCGTGVKYKKCCGRPGNGPLGMSSGWISTATSSRRASSAPPARWRSSTAAPRS